MGLTMAGLVALAGSTAATSLAWLVVVLGVMGFGFALFSSPNINCVMSAVTPRDYGLAAGVQSTMRVLGQMTSMAVTMLLFALLIGAVEIDAQRLPAFLQTFRLAYLIFAGLCALGILASLARGPGQPPRAAPPTVAAPPTTATAGPRAAPVLPPAGNAPASSLPSGDDHG
jgi:MFS family permease